MKNRRHFLCLALAFAMGGCGGLPSRPKDVLVRHHPDFFSKTVQLYEISLDFWEKMVQAGHQNEARLIEAAHALGYDQTDEGRQKLSALAGIDQAGQRKWLEFFSEIRTRMDANRDTLFYYRYLDERDPSKSNDGVLIVRRGRIRDKIILNGEGAWQGKASVSTKEPAHPSPKEMKSTN